MSESPAVLITSTRNPQIKALRALRIRKHRERQGRYWIEGIRIVEEALTRGAPVDTLVYAPELLASERARALVAGSSGVRTLAVSPEVFGSLSERDAPRGLGAAVRMQERTLDEIPAGEGLFCLVAYQLRTPGNLGAIIRTADAAGAGGVVVVEPSVDLYDPRTVRATMGSLYALPVVRVRDEAALPGWYARLRAQGLALQVVGTSAHGDRLLYEVDCRGPLVLLIGSERDGLSPEARATADVVARLPMAGSASSLNVSAATAAVVYEVVRQRLAAGRPAR
jgi:RNA methyltransferase, TrmH family